MPSEAEPSSLHHHQIYGLTVALDWAPSAPLIPSGAAPDLVVREAAEPLIPSEAELLIKGGELEGLFRHADRFYFAFAQIAEFEVRPAEIRYRITDETYRYAIELWLRGTVLAFWLEWQQRPSLHASAVVIGEQAVGFMATNKGGKSSLAATLMQRGHPLLSDDILAITRGDLPGEPPLGHPGFPQMRMWPEQAVHFVDDVDALATVHPYIEKKRVPVGGAGIAGTFCPEARPLAVLYLPERSDDVEAIRIAPVSQTEALLMLVKESFVARLIEAARWQGRRLGTLGSIVKAVPVRRLIYPNGMDLLPAVAQAVEQDAQVGVDMP